MADILIAHLNKKSGEHVALKTLVSQWDFDSKLIPKALQTVGNLFPHYSRHDESHSRQILINIERLLGESVSLLTATDTWLILEAAYWHDIGMVVPKEDISKELQSEEFQAFVATLRHSPRHDLFRFASTFDPSDLSKCFIGADTPADAVSRFNELMAEWFRRKHPARAEHIVRDPWSSAGISSPRTELMPARLFRLLGLICQMHGATFESLLSADGLPFKEAGMANEDCHPRFVACLLRMGDLLDLDDNRFCPVLQRIAGDDRPAISRAHEDKHHAIRHLRIDRDRIEVNAECQTIPGYLEAFRWFDWLKQETQNQMAHWQEIAPNRDLGLLPTLGNLTVTLSGDLQVLQKGERPQFGIDENSVIGLLQGSNLYNGAFPCIRELLQNAVDATLLCTWVRESASAPIEKWASPNACDLLRVAAPIRVELTESEEASKEIDKTTWLLRVSDGGTGISRSDLLHMLRIGGSYKNAARQRRVREMPEWMKPSGAFGIGLQSAFLLSDCIRLRTKSIFSNETLELELHSPLGPNEGLVLIRQISNDAAQRYGTTLEVKFELDRIAKSWNSLTNRVNQGGVAAQLARSQDPLLDDAFHYDAGLIADEVVRFGRKSPIRVVCEFSPLASEMVSLSEAPENDSEWIFLPGIQGHCVEFRYRPDVRYSASRESIFLYRGQTFKANSVHFPHVVFEINILSGTAGAWLSANRDGLAPKAKGELIAVVLAALELAVQADMERYACAPAHPENWTELSLFLNAMALIHGDPWKDLAAQTGNAWMDAPVIGTSIRQCLEKPDWCFSPGIAESYGSTKYYDATNVSGNGMTLISLAAHAWMKEKNGYVQTLSIDELGPDRVNSRSANSANNGAFGLRRAQPVFRFSLTPQPCYTDAAFAENLIKVILFSGNRRYLAAIRDNRWQRLKLRKNAAILAGPLMRIYANEQSLMLLPYLFSESQAQATPPQLERLYERIRPLLVDDLSIDEIRRLYQDLTAYIDDEVMAQSKHAKHWLEARSH